MKKRSFVSIAFTEWRGWVLLNLPTRSLKETLFTLFTQSKSRKVHFLSSASYSCFFFFFLFNNSILC